MKLVTPRLAAVLAASALVVAVSGACVQAADEPPLAGLAVAPGVSGGREPADDPGAVVQAAINDVSAFWDRTYPDVYGGEFQPIAGGYHAYGPDTDMPPCGNPPPSYDEISDNAFYCATDDLIAWDEASLIPWINEQFGAFTLGIVFAHEFGHAIQQRAGVTGRTIDLELQADCFAGAWTADVAAGGSRTFTIDEDTLDASVAGLVAISDQPGTREDDPLAHGSGFDRIGAFQDGFENGAQQCVPYADQPRRTVEIEFDPSDPPGGDMALDDGSGAPEGMGLLSRVEADLNDFYGVLMQYLGATWTPVTDLVLVDPQADEVTCGGQSVGGDELRGAALYCQDENTVVVDRPHLVEPLYEIGDFAVAAEIARLWAEAAQDQLGVALGADAALQADCLTGVWAFARFPDTPIPSQYLEMSPGDLDEGIMGFLAYDTAPESGTVFERTDALRTGFVYGYTGCGQYGPLG